MTEIPFIEHYSDINETIDTILDDGTLLLPFTLLAIGITHLTIKLVNQSMQDELTGLYNRKKFKDISLEAFDLIYFDLNGLKKVNDTKGHAVARLAHFNP